uniref:BTB domain-containing protein n=1 Tax=Scleropages formosus TaxID=113540 RepID=A0A8C9VPJ8_SCLFO
MTVQLHNQQYSCFLHQANKLRQLGAFCDTVIVVESQTFRAHSLLLACASKKLENVLSSRQHGQQYHCTLDLLSSRTFQQILDYVYTETLEVSTEDLHGLFKAAQLLEMHQLGEQCRAQLETLNSAPDACQEEAGAAQQAPLDMLQGSPSREEQSDLEVIERSSSPPHHLKNPRPDSTLLVAVPPRPPQLHHGLCWDPPPFSPRPHPRVTGAGRVRQAQPAEKERLDGCSADGQHAGRGKKEASRTHRQAVPLSATRQRVPGQPSSADACWGCLRPRRGATGLQALRSLLP